MDTVCDVANGNEVSNRKEKSRVKEGKERISQQDLTNILCAALGKYQADAPDAHP